MNKIENVSLLLLPSDALGDSVLKQLHIWHEIGMVADAIILRESSLSAQDISRFRVTGTFLSGLDTEDSFGLFEFLGSQTYKNRDLVIPWLLMNEAPNLQLLKQGHSLKVQIEKTLSSGGTTDSARKNFYSVLLSVPSIDREPFLEKIQSAIDYSDFDLNVYVSPEIKATPEASSIPVISDWPDYPSFVAAQIVSVAGLWSGNSTPLSSLVRSNNPEYFPAQQKVLVLRSLSSAVIAKGLASKIIKEALSEASDQSVDPYADFGGEDRPQSIRPESGGEINPAIMAAVERITNLDSQLFNWTSKQKPKDRDFRRRAIQTLKFFIRFVALCFSDMAYRTKAYFGNKFSGAVDKVFGETLEEYPERYFGINEELKRKFDQVELLERDEESIDALAIAATAFDQKASLWKDIRKIIFESLDTAVYRRDELNRNAHIEPGVEETDGKDSETKVKFLRLGRKKSLQSQFGNIPTLDEQYVANSPAKSKTLKIDNSGGKNPSRVLPGVNYVATNPADKFIVDPIVADSFGIEAAINFEESAALKKVVNSKLLDINREIKLIRARMLALESEPVLQEPIIAEVLEEDLPEVDDKPLGFGIDWDESTEPSQEDSLEVLPLKENIEDVQLAEPILAIEVSDPGLDLEHGDENPMVSSTDSFLDTPPQSEKEQDSGSQSAPKGVEDDLMSKFTFTEEG